MPRALDPVCADRLVDVKEVQRLVSAGIVMQPERSGMCPGSLSMCAGT